MEEVFDNLYVGADRSCNQSSGEWAVVHACKHPCHQRAVGYRGSLPQSHNEYLVAERETDLYLNMVDMDRQLSHEFTEPIVAAALGFIEKHIVSRDVLVHCNQGMSRSPALAMLYLAKREGVVPDSSYGAAREAFSDRYPRFQPGRGVDAYLREYWTRLE